MYDFNAQRWFRLIIPTTFVECLSYEQQIACLAKYKQDKLVEGENIVITDNGDGTSTISATGSATGGSTYTLKKLADSGSDIAKYQLVDTGTHEAVGDIIEIPNQAYDDTALRTLITNLQRNFDSLSVNVEDQATEINNLKTSKQDKINTATATASSGDTASASVSFTDGQMSFNFTLPKGDKGDTGPQGTPGNAATIRVGMVSQGDPDTPPIIRNVGTDTDAVLNFIIPRGEKGDTGPQGLQGISGNAATIQIGSVSQGEPDTVPIVTNSGTDTAAVLNFTIPKGEKGDMGPQGVQGPPGPDGGLPYPTNPAMLAMLIEGSINANWGTVTAYTIDESGNITYTQDNANYRQSGAPNINLMAYFDPFPVNSFDAVKLDIANNNSGDIKLISNVNSELVLHNTLDSGCQLGAYYENPYSYFSSAGTQSTATISLKDNVLYSCPCSIQLLKATSTLALNSIIPANIVIKKAFEGSGKTGFIMTLVPSETLTWSAVLWDDLFKIIL